MKIFNRDTANYCLRTVNKARWELLAFSCFALVAASRNRRMALFTLPAAGSLAIVFRGRQLRLSGQIAERKLQALNIIQTAAREEGISFEEWADNTLKPEILRGEVTTWPGYSHWCLHVRNNLAKETNWDKVDEELNHLIGAQTNHLDKWQVKYAWLVQFSGALFFGGCSMICIYTLKNPKSLRLGP